MTTRYLNKVHVIAIHKELIEQFGGLYGIRDESLLESAEGRYQSGYYGDVIAEVAALMESLGINHPFNDGNKRIAVTAPLVFLMANGYVVNLDEAEAFEFIIRALEHGDFTKSHLEDWIHDNANSR